MSLYDIPVMVLYEIGLMMYRLLRFVGSILELVWFLCNLTSFLIPWLFLGLLLLCIASRFLRLRPPPEELVRKLLERDENRFPVANQGGGFDCPENSLAAMQMVSKYRLDDGEEGYEIIIC